MKKSTQALLSAAVLATIAHPLFAQVTFSIDETKSQSAISPYIYGLNQSLNSNVNATFERAGGNRWTAYNYTNNLSNAGSDYYYENDTYLGGGSTPAGAVLPTVTNAQSNNAGVLLTVPINGWVAEQVTAPLMGNPTSPPSLPNYTPEFPTQAQDPNPAANHVYENGFVQIIKNAWQSTPNQLLAFDLDNEPALWNSTHQEVHPAATTYAELLADSVAYATMIKSVAPTAKVFGPAAYGWEGYLNLQNAPDSAANGDFLNYYLKNMAAASQAAGVRLLDSLDLHWYPEATGLNAKGQATRITNNDNSPGVVAARLQAARSLWDPTYVESSWITQYTTNGQGIDLIPREQAKIAANYPGTQLSFSEYNYGGGNVISGGIAEADVLGVFGKYGVYAANEWPGMASEPFITAAMQMYRNYDGHDSTFGDTEVQAADTDTVNTSVYASIDSTNPNHLTLVVINKEATSVTAALNIADGGIYNSAAVYRLTAGNSSPQFAGNISLSDPTAFNYTMPAYSVSTISLFSLPTNVTWTAGGGGSWVTSGNWLSGAAPLQAEQTVNFTNAINANSTITLDGNSTVGNLYFNSTKSYTITPGAGGSLTLNNINNPSTIIDAAGSHTLAVPLVLISNTTATVTNPGDILTLAHLSGTGALTITGSGVLRLSPNSGATTLTALSVQTGATLDLTNNKLLIKYATNAADPVAAITAALTTGFHNGAWNGSGINSSLAAANGAFALAYADGNRPADSAVSGIAPNQLILKYTLAGDAHLENAVGFDDLVIVAQNFGTTGHDWAGGNFTYDPTGSVGFADLVAVAQNFGFSSGISEGSPDVSLSPAWQSQPLQLQSTAVNPEPASVTLVAMIAFGSLCQRKKRHKCTAEIPGTRRNPNHLN